MVYVFTHVLRFPVNTIIAWIINDYHEQGNIIITNLLLPLGHISKSKWDESERNMKAAGVAPVIEAWPERCRTWFYAHGGKLDPKTGEVLEQASLKEATDELLKAIAEALAGVYEPEREKDELSRALKNPEQPGRT